MSTLQVAGTVVGAIIGAIVIPGAGAGPGAVLGAALTGAAVGGAVGSVANSILNPPHIEGARLGDLSIQGSGYGAVRPVGYGRFRLAGTVFWAIPLIEHKRSSRSGGKGGPVTTSYDYGATFAVMFCEGPIDAVVRIWADSKLVYDASSGVDTIQRTGFNFRFYSGNGTQTADSIIEADKGVGNVPGYRGTCYIVFDDMPLADFGNRMPNITAELIQHTVPAFDHERLIRASPSLFSSDLSREPVAINPFALIGYVFADPFFDVPGIVEFDIATMTTTREKLLSDVLAPLESGDTGGNVPFYPGVPVVGPDGALYLITTTVAYGGPHIVRIDPNTLLATAEYAFTTGLTGRIAFLTYNDVDLGVVSQLMGQDSGLLSNHLVVLTVPALTLVDNFAIEGTNAIGICGGKIGNGLGEGWVMSRATVAGAGLWYITKLTLQGNTTTAELMATYVASDFNATAADFSFAYDIGTLIYDEGDDSILFRVPLVDGASAPFSVHVKWSQTSGIIFSTITPTDGNPENSWTSRVSGGTYSVLNAANPTVTTIDTATGDILSDVTWPISLATVLSGQVYDSDTKIIIANISGDGHDTSDRQWAKLRLGRITGAVTTLGDIFADQCARAGLLSGDIDVTALTDVVEGFVISQRALVSDVLSPLMGAYLVDAVEIDGVLTFRHRGGAVAAALAQDDLLRISDTQEPFTETRQQEIELPMRVTLTYIDRDSDFQSNTQTAKRARHPNPTVLTDNQTDINLAIVTTATPAKQMVERILYALWTERSSFACRLAPKYGWLDAASPVTLTLDDGYVIRGRLGKADVGVDHSLDVTIIQETTGQYVSAAVADPGVPWIGSTKINNPAASKLILLDTPLLRDTDDLGGRAIRGYWAGASYRASATFPGAQLDTSPDSTTWTTIDAAVDGATWGWIETAPADPVSCWRTQFDGTMTVRIAAGDFVPSPTDDLGLANLHNPMVVIKANGETEVIQYRDVTALGSGRYTLAVFYRGVRGTDAMAGGIAAGDLFVFLDPVTINEIDLPIADHNLNEFYRLISAGALAGSALIEGFKYHGRDLMPYAPSVRAAALSGSDIVISWLRRTRMGGELRDGIDTVPLNEATEAYEIDILDAPGGVVLRTLTATSPTVTYHAADITTDFGSTPAALSVDVYQMSAVVGRGFATETLLEVA